MSRLQAPPPQLRSEAGQLHQTLSQLRLATLRRVLYGNFTGEAFPADWASRSDQVQPIDMAVALQFDHLWLRLDWAMPSITSGLAVNLLDRPDFGDWGVADVTGEEFWSAAVGTCLVGIRFAWFTAEDGAEEALLALALQFPTESLVVSLGECAGAGVRFLPDSLVVSSAAIADCLVVECGGVWAGPPP